MDGHHPAALLIEEANGALGLGGCVRAKSRACGASAHSPGNRVWRKLTRIVSASCQVERSRSTAFLWDGLGPRVETAIGIGGRSPMETGHQGMEVWNRGGNRRRRR